MDKCVCDSCFKKYILEIALYFSTRKVKTPDNSKLKEDLNEFGSLP